MEKVIKNNKVTIMGIITGGFTYSHEILGEKFYVVEVQCKRLSENCDIIPIMVSERLVDVTMCYMGDLVCVNGQFRSYNRHEEQKNRLILSVFAREIEFLEEVPGGSESNQIFLDGYICKEPVYRKTPLGREIADVLLAVNRPYGKSDYLPVIFWGRAARFVSGFSVGERLEVNGRIQSRTYIKKIGEEETEERTAYEVSASKVKVPEN